jgi:hypothetical protein
VQRNPRWRRLVRLPAARSEAISWRNWFKSALIVEVIAVMALLLLVIFDVMTIEVALASLIGYSVAMLLLRIASLAYWRLGRR